MVQRTAKQHVFLQVVDLHVGSSMGIVRKSCQGNLSIYWQVIGSSEEGLAAEQRQRLGAMCPLAA